MNCCCCFFILLLFFNVGSRSLRYLYFIAKVSNKWKSDSPLNIDGVTTSADGISENWFTRKNKFTIKEYTTYASMERLVLIRIPMRTSFNAAPFIFVNFDRYAGN